MQSANTQGCLPLFLFAVFVVLFPLFLADVMITALGRLGLSPRVTLLAAMGIFIGGMINIPVRRIERNQPFDTSSCAFCAGVLGPLIGADLLHLKEIGKLNTGVASIGGAGTFDGIVLSGLLATLLA
ncbi:MAG: DUF1614 domain-containing protein [Desulfobacteraceae bacterium]|nr:DUF1614 domain-containing protein [Desulfobacteraceae bacterium]